MIAKLLVILVAVLHLGFFVLETLLWQKPTGRRVFRLDVETAKRTAALAANQGVYNAVLACGLFLGLWLQEDGRNLLLFILSAIVVVGLYGTLSVNRMIFWVQALPAMMALGTLWFFE